MHRSHQWAAPLAAIFYAVMLCSSAVAQQATAPMKFDGLLDKKDKGKALQQGIAMASLLGCTTKRAGKEATQAFYQQMKIVGDQVGSLCKQKRAEEARIRLLAALKLYHTHDVATALRACYTAQEAMLTAMVGEPVAQDAARYMRWLGNPTAAASEMRNEDVCK